MGLSLAHGGHLTHGHPMNFSGKYFKVVGFSVNKETELIDYDEAERLALEHKPKMLVIGASAYARVFDWERFRNIADKVGAIFMADVAHYAGLIAAGLYPSPVLHADFRDDHDAQNIVAGMAQRQSFAKRRMPQLWIKRYLPGILVRSAMMHVIAAKAVAFWRSVEAVFQKISNAS